jgi:hypothetical protein
MKSQTSSDGSANKNNPPKDAKMSEEEIDYNVMGSFPASDPPSWTLGIRPNKTKVRDFEGEKTSPNEPSHKNEPGGK